MNNEPPESPEEPKSLGGDEVAPRKKVLKVARIEIYAANPIKRGILIFDAEEDAEEREDDEKDDENEKDGRKNGAD